MKLDSNVNDMGAAYKMGDDRSLCIKYKTRNAKEEALSRIMDTVKFKYADGKSVSRISPAGINIRFCVIWRGTKRTHARKETD